MKNKFTKVDKQLMSQRKLGDIQRQLDEIQDNGLSASDIRVVLFNKMLDTYQVPSDHFLRDNAVPKRLDDPKLIPMLEELGFSKKRNYQLH